ncbi:uncharacterized protein LOC112683680 [Sipha flava]|uniref:Uncharacterized protein LOC112683680 n=1 Tax=Sipha flava TaxID=143950 RepID=A0A8B8FJC7_9HEMI|nr:uncharacterized protein LOC112683680 [Sipha flava]
MKHKFLPESLKLAISIDNFINLDYKLGEMFVNQYKALLNINKTDLKSEMLVAKNCYDNQLENINNQEHLKQLKSIVEKSVFQIIQNATFNACISIKFCMM